MTPPHRSGFKNLEVVVGLPVLVLPAGLEDDAGAEDQHHQEDRVPQLLQVLLQNRVRRSHMLSILGSVVHRSSA